MTTQRFEYAAVYRATAQVSSIFGGVAFVKNQRVAFEHEAYSPHDGAYFFTFVDLGTGGSTTWSTSNGEPADLAVLVREASPDVLVAAARAGDLGAVTGRLAALVDDPTRPVWAKLALTPAIEAGHAAIVSALLAVDGVRDEWRTQAIVHASSHAPNAAVLDAFEAAGVPWRHDDPQRQTLLHHAAAQGCLEVITWLLERGADPQSMAGGSTPLRLAQAWRRPPEIVAALRDYLALAR